MPRPVATALLLAAAWTTLLASPAGAVVEVPRRIPFAEESGVSDAVRAQCRLPTLVPAYLAEKAPDVRLVDGLLDRNGGRALYLVITQVDARGGGAHTGAKTVIVEGTLYAEGVLAGRFLARRESSGGVLGIFQGTCDVLRRIVDDLAADIAEWLEAPTMDARLGDVPQESR